MLAYVSKDVLFGLFELYETAVNSMINRLITIIITTISTIKYITIRTKK